MGAAREDLRVWDFFWFVGGLVGSVGKFSCYSMRNSLVYDGKFRCGCRISWCVCVCVCVGKINLTHGCSYTKFSNTTIGYFRILYLRNFKVNCMKKLQVGP
jgi:hypothetical protein